VRAARDDAYLVTRRRQFDREVTANRPGAKDTKFHGSRASHTVFGPVKVHFAIH